MLHNDDVVEEIATSRTGKINDVGTSIVNGQETQHRRRVDFSDGKEPPLKYFIKEEELRLVK